MMAGRRNFRVIDISVNKVKLVDDDWFEQVLQR